MTIEADGAGRWLRKAAVAARDLESAATCNDPIPKSPFELGKS